MKEINSTANGTTQLNPLFNSWGCYFLTAPKRLTHKLSTRLSKKFFFATELNERGNIMGIFKSPEEMFSQRADACKNKGDQHWAKAKNGEGDFHYNHARYQYEQAEENRQKAEQAKAQRASFRNN